MMMNIVGVEYVAVLSNQLNACIAIALFSSYLDLICEGEGLDYFVYRKF